MSVLQVIKKIGEKIISIVEWPIKHSVLLAKYFISAEKDFPATRAAFLGLVQRVEAIGPDALAALAANGFNVADDVKVGTDLAGLFAYIKDDVLPVIESDYADYEKDVQPQAPGQPTIPDPLQGSAAVAAEAKPGPGLSAVVPA